MHSPRRAVAALSLALTATFGLAACGDDEDAGVSPEASISGLSGVQTSVALDQGFVDALGALGLTPGTIGSATLADGAVSFPITGGGVSYYAPGSVATPFVQGVILHSGSGLSLAAGGTTVQLSNFVVDPAASILYATVMVNNEIAATSAPVFFLDGSTLEPLSTQGDTAVLQGTTVKLTPTAAGLLRQTFGTDMVPDFLTIGTATITLALPQ